VGSRRRHTFWIDEQQAAGLKAIKDRDGIPEAEQFRRAIAHWLSSRFHEAGVPVNFVSRLLGHTNLTTTSRYLNIHRRGLHMAMQKFEESRKLASSLQDRAQDQPAIVEEPQQSPADKFAVS
jgi:integrase